MPQDALRRSSSGSSCILIWEPDDRMGARREATWVSIVGARPQFIKLAPIRRAIHAHNQAGGLPSIRHVIVHTGQHYDREMTELLFEELEIPEPDCNLGVGSGPHGEQLARMLEHLAPVLVKENPDWVIVYGDTNSTLAGSFMAARLGFAGAHVEAGCRSHNLAMPEEQNRLVADHLSQLLLAPSLSAVRNLHREGIGTPNDPRGRRVTVVGDVMLDVLLANIARAERRTGDNLKRFRLEAGRYYVATLHREENTKQPARLLSILQTLEMLDFPVLFPMHPRTRKVLAALRSPLKNRNVQIVAPLGYLDMLALEKNARRILTDSGGVQKEAFYLRIPCVTLRNETEWPETVELGANKLVGTKCEKILGAVHEPLPDFDKMASPFGEGQASGRILSELLLGEGMRNRRLSGRNSGRDCA